MENAQADFRQLALQSLTKLVSRRVSRTKQENTIIAIAQAKVLSGSFDRPSFWMRRDVSARSTYNKWKRNDPVFVTVLDEVCNLARTWRSSYATNALGEALEIIQVSAPLAAGKMVQLAQEAEEESVQLRAASGLLDRASMLTAPKTSSKLEADVNIGDQPVTGDQLANMIPDADKKLKAWREKRTHGDE